jgi:hypothetical protein
MWKFLGAREIQITLENAAGNIQKLPPSKYIFASI